MTHLTANIRLTLPNAATHVDEYTTASAPSLGEAKRLLNIRLNGRLKAFAARHGVSPLAVDYAVTMH